MTARIPHRAAATLAVAAFTLLIAAQSSVGDDGRQINFAYSTSPLPKGPAFVDYSGMDSVKVEVAPNALTMQDAFTAFLDGNDPVKRENVTPPIEFFWKRPRRGGAIVTQNRLTTAGEFKRAPKMGVAMRFADEGGAHPIYR